MRLYPKNLRNIEDLEREKSRLLKISRQLDREEFLSAGSFMGKKKGGGGDSNKKSGPGQWSDLFPVSNPLVKLLIDLVQRRLAGTGDKRDKINDAVTNAAKKGKSKLKAIAIEVIGGYLKWKAIELSYKGIRHIIRKRKEDDKNPTQV